MLQDELGRDWPEGFAPDEPIAEGTERPPLRWLFLSGFAFFRGVTIGDGSGADYTWLWYLIGLVAFGGLIADWTVRLGRKRHKHRQTIDDPVPLMKVLREYGVEELGALYLYLPVPERPDDREARAWLRVLMARRLVISGPWRIDASRAPPWLKKTHPGISSEDVALYEIYRLKRDRLATLV